MHSGMMRWTFGCMVGRGGIYYGYFVMFLTNVLNRFMALILVHCVFHIFVLCGAPRLIGRCALLAGNISCYGCALLVQLGPAPLLDGRSVLGHLHLSTLYVSDFLALVSVPRLVSLIYAAFLQILSFALLFLLVSSLSRNLSTSSY